MLAGASVLDWQSRRVANRYWLPFVVAAVALVVPRLAAWDTRLAVDLGLAAVLSGLFYLMWRMRLFGGADAKALMLTSWLLLDTQAGVPQVLLAALLGSLGVLILPIVLLALNAARGAWILPAMLLGVRVRVSTARQWHAWPMQDAAPDGGARWRYWQKMDGDAAVRLDAWEAAGHAHVWVTPKVPFLVFLAAGLALSRILDATSWMHALAGVLS